MTVTSHAIASISKDPTGSSCDAHAQYIFFTVLSKHRETAGLLGRCWFTLTVRSKFYFYVVQRNDLPSNYFSWNINFLYTCDTAIITQFHVVCEFLFSYVSPAYLSIRPIRRTGLFWTITDYLSLEHDSIFHTFQLIFHFSFEWTIETKQSVNHNWGPKYY